MTIRERISAALEYEGPMSVSQILRAIGRGYTPTRVAVEAMHAEGEVHIKEYTLFVGCRGRSVAIYALGAGEDAPTLTEEMLAALGTETLTAEELADLMDRKIRPTRNLIAEAAKAGKIVPNGRKPIRWSVAA